MVEGFALGEAVADAVVAAEGAVAGGEHVAEAAEAEKGVALAAEVGADADHFHHGAGDQGGFGIGSEVEAVADANGDRDHIFEGATEFGTEGIVIGVNPEAIAGKDALNDRGGAGVMASDDGGGGEALFDFNGEVWAAEDDDRVGRASGLPNLRGGLQGLGIQTFSGGGDDGVGLQRQVSDRSGGGADTSHGNGVDDHIGLDDRLGEAEIAASSPLQHRMAITAGQIGQGIAPGSSPQKGDLERTIGRSVSKIRRGGRGHGERQGGGAIDSL